MEILNGEVEQNMKSGRFLVELERILVRFVRVFLCRFGSLGRPLLDILAKSTNRLDIGFGPYLHF